MKGLVIAGTASGVGKTVATLVAIRALEDAGHAVQPAKAGPDFIDPSHHAAVAGRPSRTLDVWLEGVEGTRRTYHQGDGDLCLIEGVMGLYDGAQSSTAMVAEALDVPVVLVVDASAGMESLAATALGFRDYAARAGRDIDVVGIIAQRAHGGRHERGIREALPDDMRYYGRIPPTEGLAIPDRHLGLHMGDEAPVDAVVLDDAAAHLDGAALATVGRTPPAPAPVEALPETEHRIAMARDPAFRFYYPATIERLRDRAEVVTFAPTTGDDLPACDGLYLPGGYPELHAERLAAGPALQTIRAEAIDGLPVYGECGGMMVLGESLTTVDGDTYDMADLLPVDVTMADQYQALDHVAIEARTTTLTASTGERLRGHEFHYSRADVGRDGSFAFDVHRGTGLDGEHDGITEYATLGTYCHVHAESGAFDTFLDSLEH